MSESASDTTGEAASGTAGGANLPSPARGAGPWIPALVAALVAFALYAPTWAGGGYGFVNYDDPFVTSADNPAIGQGLGGFVSMLWPFGGKPFMNAWLPFYYGSLGLDHWLFRGDVWAWHLHSVALHACGAAMVAVLARRLGLGALAAGVAGVVFAAHPAATENVAWIASRKDVLSFLWMTFAAWAYLKAVDERRPGFHVLGALCLAISMTAKGTTLVLPLLLGVHAVLLRRSPASAWARLRAVVPYAVVSAVLTAIHVSIAMSEKTMSGASGHSIGSVLVTDFEVGGRYAALLLAPFPPFLRQSVEHGVDPAATRWASAVVGGLVLVVWAAVILRTWRSRPRVAAVLLAAALALLPFNNVLPRTSVLFAERYAHVALLPIALGIGALIASDGFLRGVAIAAPLAFAWLTWSRIPVWHDGVALWEDAAEKAPQSALVQMQLADALAARAREQPADADAWIARAESAWRDALMRAGDDLSRMRAEEGLGTHLLTTAPGGTTTEERVREALLLLDAAVGRLDRVEAGGDRAARRSSILVNRATARELLGERDLAFADWRAATQADTRNASAWNGLARMAFLTGDAKQGAEALAQSAALAPDDAPAARERSRLRLAAGDVQGAKGELEAALARNPDDYDTLLDAARLDASLQRPLDAEKRFRKILTLRPGDATATSGVVATLLDQAQARCARDELGPARDAALAAAELQPGSFAPQQMLGIVARLAGDLDESTTRLRRAHEMNPKGVRIREALASVLLERAAIAFDAHEDGMGNLLAEDAARIDAPAVTTRRARLEWGVGGWPPAPASPDERATVTRQAALRALTYLAMGRAADASPEILVAERGSRGGDVAFRRNVLRLLVRCRFLEGRPDDAVAAAEELPATSTPDAPWGGWADLATALVERGIVRRGAKDTAGAAADFDRARKTLDAAGAHGMPVARRHLRRGEIHFAEEHFIEATREFDLASDADSTDPEPLLDRAAVWRTHFLLEEDKSYLTGAERDLRAALSVAPSDPRAMAALGEVLVLAGKPSEAFPWLQKALIADPSQTTARRLLVDLSVRAGRSHLEKKELKEARDVADRALALEASVPDALVYLGDVMRAQGEWDHALAQYEKAAAEYPDSVEPRAALAKYYFDAGHAYLLDDKRRAAARAFRRCKTYDQTKFDVSAADDRLHQIAVAAFQDGIRLRAAAREKEDAGAKDDAARMIEESAKSFETSVIAEPTHEGRFNLGLVLTEAGRLEDAVTAYDAAIESLPDDVALRINRAAVLLRLGRWDEAETDYRWIVEKRPEGDKDRAAAERQILWIAEQKKDLDGEPQK